MGHASWHVLLEGAAAGVLVLWEVLLVARAPRPWSGNGRATTGDGADGASQAGRGLGVSGASALLWATAVPVALTHGTRSHQLALPTSP